jgi:trigger factor
VNVTVENVGPCKRLMRVEVDPETVETQWNKALAQLAKQVRLPGFRPGKAPRALVEKQFGPAVREEAQKRVVDETFREAVKEQDLRPLLQPELELGELERGKPFSYTATIEIFPEFELPEYKGLPVQLENRKVTEDDIDRAMDALREQRATYEDVDREVTSGDFVVVNYKGTCEGKPITEFNPTAKGITEKEKAWLLVETSQFIPGFTDQLLGAKAGAQRTVKVTFPPDFVIPEVGGKEGVYEVTVLEVKEKKLPPLDDEFAKSFKAPDLETLREGVAKDLENELEAHKKKVTTDQVVNNLLARFSCELPESLVEEETRNVVFDIVRANADRGLPKEAIDAQKDQIYAVANKSAQDRLKARFVFQRIAEKENIAVTREELTQRLLQMAAQYQIKPEKLVKQLQERNALGEVQYQILSNKVIAFLEEHARVEVVPVGSTTPAGG